MEFIRYRKTVRRTKSCGFVKKTPNMFVQRRIGVGKRGVDGGMRSRNLWKQKAGFFSTETGDRDGVEKREKERNLCGLGCEKRCELRRDKG
jgi:hypothetical protein